MPTPRTTGAARSLPRVTLTLLLLVALAISIALAGSGNGVDRPQAASLPVEEAQSEVGRDGYAQHCAICHGARLEGMDHFPPIAGTVFQRRWSERTLGDLYTYIHETMPLGAGGSLDDETYAAIVTYVLTRNGVEAGEITFEFEDEGQLALPLALAGWAVEGQ